jgi:hypothetical protein
VKNTKSIIFDHKDVYIFLAVVLLFLLLYGKTLAVDLLISDSAEFQVLSRELGLTHAMGYPIYILLGKLFSYLPVKELPWRINLLSTVSASLALGLLYLLARLGVRSRRNNPFRDRYGRWFDGERRMFHPTGGQQGTDGCCSGGRRCGFQKIATGKVRHGYLPTFILQGLDLVKGDLCSDPCLVE